MALAPGTRLGPYETLSQIGAGGMGEVYKARDTRLDRFVAIKILPEHLANNPELRERFEREARTIAKLNHPHICTLYDIGQQEGTDFLVMEYLEGETLAERLKKGPLPLEQVLRYAVEVSDALDKAHRAGVTHRDIKPGNVIVTKEGTKLLDFGLAKLKQEVAKATIPASEMPTVPGALTEHGTLLGTLHYMAPEQVEGKVNEIDARTDIFAFGALVYEIGTGKRAFSGDTQASVIAKILEVDPPPMSELQPMTPPVLDRVVKKCLVKEPEKRWQTASDLHDELRWITEGGSEVGAASTATAIPIRTGWRRMLFPIAASVVVAAILTGIAVWNFKPSPPPVPVRRATISLPEGQTQPRILGHPLAISPDGSVLAYVAEDDEGQRLFLRSLASSETRGLRGTDGADMPFFSPDGEWVGFFAAGKLKTVSVASGAVLTIAPAAEPMGASWGPDGTIVFSPNYSAGLFRISGDGGTPEQLTTPDFGEAGYAHVWPQHLPNGKTVLFTIWGGGERAAVLDLDTREWKVIGNETLGGASYVSTGHLIFHNRQLGTGLLAAPFDAGLQAITGPTVQVLDDVRLYDSQSGRPYITISPDGTAVYVAEASEVSTLAWMDRSGALTPILRQEGSVATPRLSPDGQRIAFHDEQGNAKVLDMERGTVDIVWSGSSEFSVEAAFWHPQGDRLAVGSNLEGSWDFYQVVTSERREPEPLLVRKYDQSPTSWSSNGTLLAFQELHPVTGYDLWILPLGDEPMPVLVTPANEYLATFSPDGRLLAYVSDESGRAEIYVRLYPEGGTHIVSASGGGAPAWSKDGRELFFRKGPQFLAVEISSEPDFRVSAPKVLHEIRFDRGWGRWSTYYDVAPDGRFLVVADRSTAQFKVVLNWFEELKQRVPVP